MFQKLLITDYMFVKDRLFASLNLDDKEMSLYDTVATLLERNIIKPIITLQVGSFGFSRGLNNKFINNH